MISKSYYLDVTPCGDPPIVHVSQYDTDFQILLYIRSRSGELTIQNGTRVDLRGTKPDGQEFTMQCSLSGSNTVLLQGNENLTDVAGKGIYELCFTHNNKWLHTDNFVIKVEPSPAERSENAQS